MTPEARDYLDKAIEDLADARTILSVGLAKAAARGAYYAAFHAAEAVIVARTGAVAKTHSGVRTTLARLLKDASTEDRAWLAFMARAYKYKELSDYGVGRAAVVTHAEAEELIVDAARFIARVAALI